MHRLEKVLKLFPKEGRGRKIEIRIPSLKAIILTVTFTNPKFAQRLAQQGIPLISDSSPEKTKTNFLVKKTQISLRTGAMGTRPYITNDKGIIERIGRPLSFVNGISVSGTAILSGLCEIARERGITEVFLRIRHRMTEVGLTRRHREGMQKFETKIYFIPEGKVNFKDKRGTKKIAIDNLGILKELLEAAWFLHCWDNPDTFVFALTMRQPDKQPTHTLSLP